jgi:hypothetical protein
MDYFDKHCSRHRISGFSNASMNAFTPRLKNTRNETKVSADILLIPKTQWIVDGGDGYFGTSLTNAIDLH